MGKDINFTNRIDSEGFRTEIGVDPTMASGNKLLANIFEITFLTNINESLLANGYGGNGINTLGVTINNNDIQSISAMIKIAIDNTVAVMIPDQSQYGDLIDPTERIVSADIKSIEKISENVSVDINIVPEQYEAASEGTLFVSLPL